MRAARSLPLVTIVVAILGVCAATAVAGAPHFSRASATIVDTGSLSTFARTATSETTSPNPALLVSWVEVGLGSTTIVTYEARADASATYACINRGGKNPSASNKHTVSDPVGASGTFQSDRNGRISGSLLTSSISGPGDFSCPSGQELVLASVTFTNITLTDVTNGVATSLGSLSKTYVAV
jgi:hypothetical protein